MKDETRRKIDKAVKISLIVAGLLLICNDVYWRWYGGSSSTADNNVNRTMEQLKARNESARSEIADSERYVSDAEKHVERADATISRSEVTAKRNEESTEQLQKLISECQTIVRRQQSIIQDIDRTNRNGAQECKDN